MDRKTAARTLREIGRLLEVTDDNPYRARAFAGAARTVETLSGDIAELIRSGEIRNLRGIGRGSSAVLEQLASGNRPQALLEAEAKVPPGVRDMLTLPGLGPKKVRTLWNELGVETLGELEYACRENRLLELKGFGPASQASVLDALSFRAQTRDRRLVHEAWTAAAALIERLRGPAGRGASAGL
jgi:DNA polymerase (family 10)